MRTEHWYTPEGYVVSSYCTECGRDFTNDALFEKHRTGTHEYTLTEGLRFNPPLDDGRRCKTDEELIADGMRPMTKDEMNETIRHRHRIEYGIQMWFDPVRAEKTREAFNRQEPDGS